MVQESVCVRFAPSPTGFLHIGGARTALFNWLFARAMSGKFLLRIEDTDQERSESRFTEDILESLRWLGLDWDAPPVFQSSRLERYQQVALSLLADGKAFRCDCSAEALDAIRKQCERDKQPYRYPGFCREKKNVNNPSVIRLKMPSEGETVFKDLIRGDITFPNKDLDDWVIERSNGFPTYNFVVVVDDHDQSITHVLRGEDHINNTPRQAILYQAIGWRTPLFAHLPMILGSDRSKLSKRHGAVSTLEYRRMGYLPDAVINFLARLGWSYGDQEIFSREELIKNFSLDHIGKANAIFSHEKLDWLNGHYMRSMPSAQMVDYLKKYFSEGLKFCEAVEARTLEKGVSIIQGKVKNIPELLTQMDCLFGVNPQYDLSKMPADVKEQTLKILKQVEPVLLSASFQAKSLEDAIRPMAETMGLSFGKLAQAVRYAATGGKVSPGLFEMLEVLGHDLTLQRVQKCISAIEKA